MDLRAFLSKVIDLIERNKSKILKYSKILEYSGYAALALAAPYLAILAAGGSELLQAVGQPLMQEAFERLKRKLGERKFSEEDVKRILEIAEEDAEVRKDLLSLMGAVIKWAKEEGLELPWLDDLTRGLNELREKFEDLRGQIDVIRRDVDELRERVTRLEEIVRGGTAERLDAEKLRETLGRSLQNRKPVISERLKEKVNEVARMVNDALNRGESIMVVLKGEEGVGKTVALYLICERLLASGRELYWTDRFATQGTLKVLVPSGKVLVVDDIAERKLDLPSDVTIIATARTHLWEPSERWVEVELLVGDQDQRGILKSMLNAKEVKYTEGGVEELLREPRTPLYLDALTDELRQRGEELNEANAAVMPSGVRETITGIMNNLWERDRLSAALLCCLAHTETGWLHFAQLESLKSLTKKLGFEGDGSYEDLLYSVGYSKGLKHGGWARVLRDYAEGRQELRGLDLRGLVRESCIESLKHMGRLRASSAAELAARAVENFPDLAIKVLDLALKQEKDKRDMIMDAVALRAPGKIGEWLRKRGYDWKRAFDLASDMEAPSAELEIYGFAEGPLRELVKSDERFKPNLAMVLNNLGASYSDKGMLDRAIELYKEARSIYEELLRSDERFKPDLAGVLNSLGISYSDKGMLDRAIELQEEARSIYEELFKLDERFKPDLAVVLNNLGASYYLKGMLDRAIELQERARSIFEELFKLDERFKPNLAKVLSSLGIS
ncbi:MAG: tetratricopeptide repeat protein, partial [Candidatus Korarchaeum sp.]